MLFKEESLALIPRVLGEAEIRQRSIELAQQYDELISLKEERKRVTAEFKSKEDYIGSQVRRLSEICKTGIESFEMPCAKVFDVETKQVWWETSDGMQYHKREMRDDEFEQARNGNLFEDSAM